ncbi:hypothetical protein ACH4T9_31190 [Micromonospora sp. NPDC020750]|uniref:hypothetical protein n=1 Tax=unclassified Micromonospora TaxID=2617518 RepID=UPI00378F09DD
MTVANGYFAAWTEGVLDETVRMNTAVLKVALVRGYTFSAGHKFVSDITTAGGMLNGTSAALTGKTFVGGVFDADDTSVASTVSTANHGWLLFQASAATGGADVAAAVQRVIAWFDTGTGLPVQPGTGNAALNWASTSPKILKVG